MSRAILDRLRRRRLRNELLTHPASGDPASLVRWFGAVQAQDYPGARWGLGLRNPSLTDAAVVRAYDAGAIVRTHILRPTWHFVAPEDLRWMQALTRSRVLTAMGSYLRQTGLDAAVRARARRVIGRALEGGHFLTRQELKAHLQRAGIPCEEQRLAYLVMDAELHAIVCSGPMRGKHFTYALVEERVPPAPMLDHDAACAALVRRFFTSHGPATLRDLRWWSGLTVRDIKAGIALAGDALVAETIQGLTYYSASAEPPAPRAGPARAWLLPNYDEYLVAFQDRGLSVGPADAGRTRWPPIEPQFEHVFVVDGLIAGTWKRAFHRDAVEVRLLPYRPLTEAERRLLRRAANRLSAFVGMPCLVRDADGRML
jgi:hypothetical protein